MNSVCVFFNAICESILLVVCVPLHGLSKSGGGVHIVCTEVNLYTDIRLCSTKSYKMKC